MIDEVNAETLGLAIQEGYVAVPGGRIFYRSFGQGGTPIVTIHGGPGVGHDYLEEPFMRVARERQVIFYDQLGVGDSDRPDDPSLWTVGRAKDELAALIDQLNLERPHIYGHSWGGMLAMDFASDRDPPISSIIVANSPASVPEMVRAMRGLMEFMPPHLRNAMYRNIEGRALASDPDVVAANKEWSSRHLNRATPDHPALRKSVAKANMQIFQTMWGTSEWNILGNLKDWDVTDRLRLIKVPALVIEGELDEYGPTHVKEYSRLIPQSELVTLDGLSHMIMIEDAERSMAPVQDFIRRVDSGMIE